MADEGKRVRLGGVQFKVRRVPRNGPDLEGDDGRCSPVKGEIYLAADLTGSVLLDTYFHEVTHAWLWASGNGHALGLLAKCATDDSREAVEEAVVRVLSGSLRPALEAAGWTPPKRFA